MRDRAALILKVICACLVAWLAWELVKIGKDVNPLAHVTLPEVPSLPADTNAPPPVANKPPVKPGTNGLVGAINTNGPAIAGVTNSNGLALSTGTNALAVPGDTNAPTIAGDSNAVPRKRVRRSGTNVTEVTAGSGSTNVTAVTAVAVATNVTMATNTAATNLVINPSTNRAFPAIGATNASIATDTSAAPSNTTPALASAVSTNGSGSNVAVALPTNAIVSGTNVVAQAAGTNSTNAAMARGRAARPQDAAMAAMAAGPGARKPAAPLPPEIQARVDRVYESEMFAPVMHPMPMALLGIAGKAAFLRAPSGQTGMVKEGEDLGDVKLLRIGINRVLVEQDGKRQELMIFAGLGGESLLTKTNESSNETTKK